MQKANSTSGKWQRPMKYSYGLHNKWHQSKFLGRPPRRFVHTEFVQRQNKRDREERLGRCMREITRDCRDMLRKKLEEIEAYNASKIENKMIHYNCFYCNMDGHITKTCPSKVKDDALGITKKKYPVDKSMILCFRCRNHGHFANKCPTKHQIQSTLVEITIVLYTLKLGVLSRAHMRVHGMIIGMQQGFELIFKEEKCTLEYMFKSKQEKNLDVDRMKQMHNNYLDDYFESLDKERMDREERKARPLEATEQPEVHNFHGFMDFLNLIKKDEIVSREWDAYRSRFDKIDEKVASEAVGKGKEKLEHFGIKLEEEEACKPQQTAHYRKEESQIKCYKCQDLRHYAFECPLKNKRKYQNKVSSYKASTSNLAEGMDSNNTSATKTDIWKEESR
ncbi:ARID DNA-binding domain-containing protein [Tanacetum coccineum]